MIQKLKEAETKALKIVEEAKAYQTQRLKQAESEIEQQLVILKNDAAFLKQVEAQTNFCEERLEQEKKLGELDARMTNIQHNAEQRRDELVELVHRVTSTVDFAVDGVLKQVCVNNLTKQSIK